jgi:hypothetical protein
LKIFKTLSLIVEAGISQVDFLALTAFLILVSKSAIGSVVIIISPTRFRDARKLSIQGTFSKTQTTHFKFSHKSVISTAQMAAIHLAHSKLWFACRFNH